jgi:hypothetical protein
MTIRFTKGRNKPDTLTCRRDDGSCTWAALNLPAGHDLGHYAIETTLGFRDAFFGLLASGWDIQDFGRVDPKTGRKPAIPPEAIQAEALAGLLDMERRSAHPPAYDIFLEMLVSACAGLGLPAPALDAAQLEAIRGRHAALLRQWTEAAEGTSLELDF